MGGGGLMEQLRLKGIPSLNMVHGADIESNGEFSVTRSGDMKCGGKSPLDEG